MFCPVLGPSCLSSRPERPAFSFAPRFGAPAANWRDRGKMPSNASTALLWHRHSCLCSWVSLLRHPDRSGRFFSFSPRFGAPAANWRDRGKTLASSSITLTFSLLCGPSVFFLCARCVKSFSPLCMFASLLLNFLASSLPSLLQTAHAQKFPPHPRSHVRHLRRRH